MVAVLAGLLALTVICLAVAAVRSQLSTAPTIVGATLLVATKDGDQFRGVVHGQHADRWILRDAVKLGAPADQPVAGAVHVLASNVAWAQEPEAGR